MGLTLAVEEFCCELEGWWGGVPRERNSLWVTMKPLTRDGEKRLMLRAKMGARRLKTEVAANEIDRVHERLAKIMTVGQPRDRKVVGACGARLPLRSTLADD